MFVNPDCGVLNDNQEIERRINTLRRKGPREFSFSKDVKDDLRESPPKLFAWGIFFVVVSLLALTGLFILSYFVILCDTGVVRKWDNGV